MVDIDRAVSGDFIPNIQRLFGDDLVNSFKDSQSPFALSPNQLFDKIQCLALRFRRQGINFFQEDLASLD